MSNPPLPTVVPLPSLTNLSSQLALPPSTFVSVCVCVLSQSLSLEFFIEVWIRIAYRSMGSLPMATPLKKISLPPQSTINSVGREYPRSLSLHARMLLGPVLWRSCASHLGCYEFKRTTDMPYPEFRVSQLLLPPRFLWLLPCLALSSIVSPEP